MTENKNKYIQIFSYLMEFCKLRAVAVRDIESQDTAYPEKLWLNKIPENPLFQNIIRPEFNKKEDFWIKLKKPKEPIKPEIPPYPILLEDWIELPPITDISFEESIPQPTIKQERSDANENLLKLADYPNVEAAFMEYRDMTWEADLAIYRQKLDEYKLAMNAYELLSEPYKKLFTICNKVKQFGDEYELVVGVGLMNFHESSDKTKIFRGWTGPPKPKRLKKD